MFLSGQDQPHTDSMSCYQVAMGFIDVANEMMCRPIRALTQVYYQSFIEAYSYITVFVIRYMYIEEAIRKLVPSCVCLLSA